MVLGEVRWLSWVSKATAVGSIVLGVQSLFQRLVGMLLGVIDAGSSSGGGGAVVSSSLGVAASMFAIAGALLLLNRRTLGWKLMSAAFLFALVGTCAAFVFDVVWTQHVIHSLAYIMTAAVGRAAMSEPMRSSAPMRRAVREVHEVRDIPIAPVETIPIDEPIMEPPIAESGPKAMTAKQAMMMKSAHSQTAKPAQLTAEEIAANAQAAPPLPTQIDAVPTSEPLAADTQIAKAPAVAKTTAPAKAPIEKAPAAEKAPASAKAPTSVKTPTVEKTPDAAKAPTSAKTSAVEKAPAPAKTPTSAKATTVEKTPASEKAVATEKAPAAEKAPASAKAPASTKAPTVEKAPDAAKAPIEKAPDAAKTPAPAKAAAPKGAVKKVIRYRCPKCGQILGADETICPGCGVRLKRRPQTDTPT